MFTSKCKYCGRTINFIKTLNGKWMPCELFETTVKKNNGGAVLTDYGELIRDLEIEIPGFPPHFAHCPKFIKHRENKNKQEKKIKQLTLF